MSKMKDKLYDTEYGGYSYTTAPTPTPAKSKEQLELEFGGTATVTPVKARYTWLGANVCSGSGNRQSQNTAD